MLNAQVAGKGVCEAVGALGTGCDIAVEGLEGRKHVAMDASLMEALPKQLAGDRVKSLLEVHEAAVERAFLSTGLVNEGFEGEDVVSSAVAPAETCLGGGADTVFFGPLG